MGAYGVSVERGLVSFKFGGQGRLHVESDI